MPRKNGESETEPFWRRLTLDEMSPQEWESLCDGCARCCLNKLEDWDTGAIYWTNVRCSLLDETSCRCSDYPNRTTRVPDCIPLDAEAARTLTWLPPTCGYRLVAEGRDLYWWHPLVSGDPDTVHLAGISVRGRTVSEAGMAVEDYENHLVEWPGERPDEREGLPVLGFTDAEGFTAWLERQHDRIGGLWLRFEKGDPAGGGGLGREAALDIAATFGWAEGRKAPEDDRHWLQRLARRTPRSRWSAEDRNRAEALIAAGRMRPAGLAAVAAAQADGRWEAAVAAAPRRPALPADLLAAFAVRPEAEAAFLALDPAERHALVRRLDAARSAPVRAGRIAELVERLSGPRPPR